MLRTHSCGALRPQNVGETITICGWVANRRDHGGIFFVDLRDRYGITQVTVDPEVEGVSAELLKLAGQLRSEDVLSVTGVVRLRDASQINPGRVTGAIEIFPVQMELLAGSETPPFEILDKSDTSIDLRLEYRYLDIRRKPVLQALEQRSRFVHALRSYFIGEDFIEVETPILTKATPEGARDYLVPSRVHKGKFYALPQSPQVFKQILMVAGIDKYFQIARCFRDEDLRADRQPEFTQLDLEMSFVDEEDVFNVMEAAVSAAFSEVFGIELDAPFQRLSFEEAMRRFGTDKPDLRFGMELVDLCEEVRGTEFRVFSAAIEGGGVVQALCVRDGARLSRKEIDGYGEYAKSFGAKGLAWMKLTEEGVSGPVARFFPAQAADVLRTKLGGETGDLLLFAADSRPVVQRVLGELRNRLAKDFELTDPKDFRFAWITAFPLFDWSEERQRFEPSHHPFTAPLDPDADFASEPAAQLSRAYDLVLNGWELGSGSIRIHRTDVQERLFAFLGLGPEECQAKFGHLLRALRYGAPPHGGFAMGIDRILALAIGSTSLRDVLAFPKTTSAACPLTGAPSEVSQEQLDELAISVVPPEASKGVS